MSSRAVKTKRKIPEELLRYREAVGPGKIMSPETFKRIVRKARKRGARDPEAVAGRAYWRTLQAKARGKKKK